MLNCKELPYLSSKQIKKAADEFRLRYWGDSLPVNIEKIIEGQLGIEIRPIPNLKKDFDKEAIIISPSWDTIIVDKRAYEDDRLFPRLRFSLAHEIGHLVLHKKYYESLQITSEAECEEFTLGDEFSPEIDKAEKQANIFANILLVPREHLWREKNKILKEKQINTEKFTSKNLYSYMANPLSKHFQVSSDVIRIALEYLEKDLK